MRKYKCFCPNLQLFEFSGKMGNDDETSVFRQETILFDDVPADREQYAGERMALVVRRN